MAVYVDDMYLYEIGRYGHMKMSHLAADTTEELLDVVDRIGVARRWLQEPGGRGEHFDISISKRRLAIQAGAVPITYREMSLWMAGGKQAPPDTGETFEQGTLWGDDPVERITSR